LSPSGKTEVSEAAGYSRPTLEVAGLSKRFSGVTVLRNVDLEIAPGEVHALLGGNGSGKSTLIKILSGYHRPEPGSRVLISGQELHFGSPQSSYRLGCRVVHQDGGLVDELSVTDNLSLTAGYPCRWGTIRESAARQSAAQALRRLGLDLDPRTPVGDLSAASRTEVALVRALREDAQAPVRLLVLDEPTATLPVKEVRQLLDTVRRVAAQGVAVLYVSHRLSEAFDVADTVTVLRDGRKVTTEPISGLSRDQIVTLITGLGAEEVRARPPAAAPEQAAEQVLSVGGLRAGPVRDLSFTVGAGEIVGLAGITGSGCEIVLGSVFGVTARRGGTVTAGGRRLPPLRPDLAIQAGVAHLPADRKALSGLMELTATENLTLVDLAPFWRGGWLWRGRETAETKEWVNRLGVRPRAGAMRPLSTFSGGNQQKILFAKWLRCSPGLLLLDEPTQGVDVAAKGEIHRLVQAAADQGTGIAVSSTDFDELAAICHRVLVLHEGHLVAELQEADISPANITRYALGTALGVAP
jgi:ribose transport system ATP-binding protein